jgi:glycosyltransferase involved in cell wall biosynthesis
MQLTGIEPCRPPTCPFGEGEISPKDRNRYFAFIALSHNQGRVYYLSANHLVSNLANMNSPHAPLISVVIPTYNRADLIPKAIQSVLDQTYQNWELIIVDNYSDDGTKEVINSFRDPRISMLLLPRTGSVAASRNMGVRHSKGDWVAFLDSDDWWFTTKLSTVCEVIRRNPDLIYHDLEIVSGPNNAKSLGKTKSRKLKDPIFLDLLLNGNDISLSSVTVRKSIFMKVNGMNESLSYVAIEDYETWLRIAQMTSLFVYIPKTLGAYRLHDGNLGKINNFQYLSSALKSFLDELDKKQLCRYQSLYIYQIARSNYQEKRFKETTRDLLFVIRFGKVGFALKALIMLLSNMIIRGIFPKKIHFNN